jgi:hypothetical protein
VDFPPPQCTFQRNPAGTPKERLHEFEVLLLPLSWNNGLSGMCAMLFGAFVPKCVTYFVTGPIQDAFLAKLLFQYLVFSPQVLDNILLMAINPTRDDEEE